ncbi:protein kinase domain-containing protein [Nannocystis punicea]|uniref:Serine/threonine-protein kinase n=1 Tax=Nannocystis punicea TaxID=2995304 RepID=A0ABY7GU92_9BACT|nr:serine/threonine-protein kinase [Nannocystis poenicansa]WAS90536.1 serine/threonine-protein kinase [Nannocystis poenicansa]
MTTPPDAPTPSPTALPGAHRWTLFTLAHEGSPSTAVLGGRFEVGELLGSGASSCVYACRDLELQSMAAIKLLKVEGTEERQRFVAEARLLANLRHPNVVQVLAVGETDTKAPFMVLELLQGQNLDQRLLAEGPMPWREAVEIAAQVAGALAAMHAVGVIHRDVKSNNIVQVKSATGRPLVKLIDLGIAKVEDWQRVQPGNFDPVPRHQTEVGKIVGTPGFYPPEAALVPPNPRFDTFGLGATIYLLCTGKLPDLPNYRPMREHQPKGGFPDDLEALVAAAVAVLPEDGIGTAAEFLHRLDALRVVHVEDSSPFLFEGCYELIEALGSGAKAEVYRAYHRDAACYVALKILSEKSCASREERIRFAREARVLQHVRHAAIPELVECRTSLTRKRPYIAMALRRGKPAKDLHFGGTLLTSADVIALGRQLAGALEALHSRGILYRDVHGYNVLIDLAREPKATLIDFGMVEFEDKFYATVDQRYPTKPEERVKLGTGGLEKLEFAAPEVRSGKGWSAKSDVYSLGRLLYVSLTGKVPAKVGVPTSPKMLVPSCPRALASALLACLVEDPRERVDATGLLARFDAAADELAEDEMADEVCDEKTPEREATPSRALGCDAAPSSAPAVALSSPPSTPRSKPSARRSGVWVGGGLAVLGMIVLGIIWWPAGSSPLPQVTTDRHVTVAQVADPQPQTQPQPLTMPQTATATAPPVLPTMRVALDSAAGELRRCSDLAGGLLFVDFKVEAEASEFASVAAGRVPEAVNRCVQEATRSIRFQPTAAQIFTEEYTP